MRFLSWMRLFVSSMPCNPVAIIRIYREHTDFYEFPPRSMKPERGLFFLMPPQMSIKERKRTALMPWHEGNTILITHFPERVSPLLLPLSQLPRMEAPQRFGAVFTIGVPETPAHLSIRHGMRAFGMRNGVLPQSVIIPMREASLYPSP